MVAPDNARDSFVLGLGFVTPLADNAALRLQYDAAVSASQTALTALARVTVRWQVNQWGIRYLDGSLLHTVLNDKLYGARSVPRVVTQGTNQMTWTFSCAQKRCSQIALHSPKRDGAEALAALG